MARNIRTAKGLDQEIWSRIVDGFHKANSPEEIEVLFLNLLTNQEKETIARRLAIISLIRTGKTYAEISEKLWVSPATISAIKKSLLVNRGYKSRQEFYKKKDLEKSLSKTVNLPKPESVFERWLDYIAFSIENAPQISGPRWKFLNYSWTAPKGYWRKNKK